MSATLNKTRLTVGFTRGHPIWTIQGHALDSKPNEQYQFNNRSRSDPCPSSPITEVKKVHMIPIKHTQTLCPQWNREAEVWHKITCTKSSLSLNFGQAENHDHLTDSCPSTIESWPTAGHNQTSPQSLTSDKAERANDHINWKLWHNLSQTPKTCTHKSANRAKKQDTQRSTSSNPQENYQYTTASTLFSKTSQWPHNFHHKLFKFNFEPSKHPFQKSLKMISTKF